MLRLGAVNSDAKCPKVYCVAFFSHVEAPCEAFILSKSHIRTLYHHNREDHGYNRHRVLGPGFHMWPSIADPYIKEKSHRKIRPKGNPWATIWKGI